MAEGNWKLTDRYGFTGGPQYTSHYNDLDLVSFQKNEKMWFDIINNWDKEISKNFTKFKNNVRNGIPSTLRSCVWQLMCGSYIGRAKDNGYMDTLVDKEGDEANVKLMRRDLHRSYVDHKLFKEKEGLGQENLFKILKAYSVRKVGKSFCQAFGPLAAFFLINMPLLDAYYCFDVVNEYYITGYCTEEMDAVVMDCKLTMTLLQKTCPIAYKHLTNLEVEPTIWLMEWYVTVYTRLLPWPTLLRVWDMFLCEGVKVLFAVAVTIVKLVLGTKEKVDAAPGFYECMNILKTPPFKLLEDRVFIPLVVKTIVSTSILAKEQKNEVLKWLTEKNTRDGTSSNNNSAFTPLEKLSICRAPSKTPTLPPPQRQDASTDTAADQTTALLARMPAAGDMDGNGVSGGVCGDIADEVEDDDECGYDDSEDIGNNIVDGECGDYKDSINEVAIENE